MSDPHPWESLTPFGVLLHADKPRPIADIPIDWLRSQARAHRVVVLRGFQSFATPAALARYGAEWGDILTWPFGDVLDVVEQKDSHDHVFHSGYLPLHWDGMYVDYIPEFDIFQCVQAPPLGHGGETLFCDTARVWRDADPEMRAVWQRLSATYRIRQTGHYGGQVTSPLVEAHPHDGTPILRFNEPSRPGVHIDNQHSIEIHGQQSDDLEKLCRDLVRRLHGPGNLYQHRWEDGDVVIADNYTLLHGRKPYDPGAPRHLRRVHILGSPSRRNPAARA